MERTCIRVATACQIGQEVLSNTFQLCVLGEIVFRVWKHLRGKKVSTVAENRRENPVPPSQPGQAGGKSGSGNGLRIWVFETNRRCLELETAISYNITLNWKKLRHFMQFSFVVFLIGLSTQTCFQLSGRITKQYPAGTGYCRIINTWYPAGSDINRIPKFYRISGRIEAGTGYPVHL